MKFCVFILIQVMPFIVKVGDWALRWTEGNAAIQIAFVMLLFPVIMNAIQYYIIDAFIKKPLSYDLYAADDTIDETDDLHRREALLAGLDEPYSADSDDEEASPVKVTASHPKATAIALQESEGHLTEDHSPVPPYEPSTPSGSHREHDGRSNTEP